MESVSPVTHFASSEAKNATAGAIPNPFALDDSSLRCKAPSMGGSLYQWDRFRMMVGTFGRSGRGRSPPGNTADDVEEHRRQKDAEQGHAKGAPQHGGANRAAHFCAGAGREVRWHHMDKAH